MKHDAMQFSFDLRDARKSVHRKVANKAKKALKMPLLASTHGPEIRWAAKRQVVWLSQILSD
jgi:hypothetical protein